MLKARERLAPEGRWHDLRADLVAHAQRSVAGDGSFRAPSEYLLAYGRKGSLK